MFGEGLIKDKRKGGGTWLGRVSMIKQTKQSFAFLPLPESFNINLADPDV